MGPIEMAKELDTGFEQVDVPVLVRLCSLDTMRRGVNDASMGNFRRRIPIDVDDIEKHVMMCLRTNVLLHVK